MNKVFIDGYVATEPQIKVSQQGKKNGYFNVAVRLAQDKTEFFHVRVFDKTAEYVENWVHKGSFVVCEGRLHNYERTDAAGRKNSEIQVIVDRLESVRVQKKEDSHEGLVPQSGAGANYKFPSREEVNNLPPIDDSQLPF